MAKAIDPETVQTPALDLIDEALVDVEEGRINRLSISMPPQEGRSTRVTKYGPLWFLTRNPERRIAVVSYAASLAQEFGRDIRKFITDDSSEEGALDLGFRVAPDNGVVNMARTGRRPRVGAAGTGPVTALLWTHHQGHLRGRRGMA